MRMKANGFFAVFMTFVWQLIWFVFHWSTPAVEIVKIVLENEELRLETKRLEQEKKASTDIIEEKVQFETELLQQRIKQLVHASEQERQQWLNEKNAIDEDRKDLESRLELLRTEFDRLDDYWQVKSIRTNSQQNEQSNGNFKFGSEWQSLKFQIHFHVILNVERIKALASNSVWNQLMEYQMEHIPSWSSLTKWRCDD